MAAGTTINELTLNLSLIVHPCVRVEAIVVSDIKERLSPKKEPPTTIATIKGSATPTLSASPIATGVNATMVPTLVPIESEIKHAAKKIPANNKLLGRICNVRFTVSLMAPISLAL